MGPAGSTTTTTAGPTTTTSPTFTPPTTRDARIDGCQRVKNKLRITYSWQFTGGVGWHAPSDYSAVAAGRHQDVIDVPRNAVTSITSVRVLDESGRAHDVVLQPVLSSSSC